MRILVLNPNTSEGITARLVAAAQNAAAPGTEIVPLTAPRGFPYIATRAEAQIGGAIPLAGLAERVKDRIPVPVVDQMAAAIKQAEALVSLQVRKATAGTFRRPAAKPTLGLAQALAQRFSDTTISKQ